MKRYIAMNEKIDASRLDLDLLSPGDLSLGCIACSNRTSRSLGFSHNIMNLVVPAMAKEFSNECLLIYTTKTYRTGSSALINDIQLLPTPSCPYQGTSTIGKSLVD